MNPQENKNIPLTPLAPEMQSRFKKMSSLTSLASFPSNIKVYGQNQNEHILLFIRKDKIVLAYHVFMLLLTFLFPLLLAALIVTLSRYAPAGSINLDPLFNSKFVPVFGLIWLSIILTTFFNTFFKWYYDLNLLTNNRFIDLDLIGLFHNRLEETSILSIEDAKDTQTGIIQSLFKMGNLEIFTASGETVFNLENVPESDKIRDFVMDVVVEQKKKYGNG